MQWPLRPYIKFIVDSCRYKCPETWPPFFWKRKKQKRVPMLSSWFQRYTVGFSVITLLRRNTTIINHESAKHLSQYFSFFVDLTLSVGLLIFCSFFLYILYLADYKCFFFVPLLFLFCYKEKKWNWFKQNLKRISCL